MKELHVKSLLPVRLDKYLMDQFPALGMGRLNKALRENKIKLNRKKQPLSTRVQNGDIIKLFLNDDQLENRPTPAAVFVYEDDDIIIASKPAGIAVDGPDSDTLLRRVQTKLAAEGKAAHAVLCHRLDTGTSGLVLLAKNSAAEAFLTAAIKARDIEKRYLCVTFGRPNPPAALLRDYLLKDAERGIVRITDTTAGGAKATTLLLVVLTAVSILRGEEDVHIFGRRIENDLLRRACSIVVVYLTLGAMATLAICAMQPEFTLQQVLIEVFSAIDTVGLTAGITRQLNTASRVLLILLMYAGRLGSMTFMILLTRRKPPAPVQYPTDKILVG